MPRTFPNAHAVPATSSKFNQREVLLAYIAKGTTPVFRHVAPACGWRDALFGDIKPKVLGALVFELTYAPAMSFVSKPSSGDLLRTTLLGLFGKLR